MSFPILVIPPLHLKQDGNIKIVSLFLFYLSKNNEFHTWLSYYCKNVWIVAKQEACHGHKCKVESSIVVISITVVGMYTIPKSINSPLITSILCIYLIYLTRSVHQNQLNEDYCRVDNCLTMFPGGCENHTSIKCSIT